MKKERILYFDAIKFFAVICVFVCHFARTLEYYQISYNFKILPNNIFSVYTGTIGCVLFFIVSGAALMYVYQEKIYLKMYFRKRFLAIYPMLWVAFVIFFVLQFYINKEYDKSIPVWRLLFTITGFDGLLGFFCSTFYIVGEWFLGILIIMYILFPILRKLVNEFPYATLTVSILIGLIVDYSYNNPYISVTLVPLAWIPAIVFGMVFVKCIKIVSIRVTVLSMFILALFTLFDLSFFREMTRIYIVGISLFIVLVFLFENSQSILFRSVSVLISRYCYPVFLVHHRIMYIFMKRFSGYQFSSGDVICLFVFIMIITWLASFIIDKVTNSVMQIWRNENA